MIALRQNVIKLNNFKFDVLFLYECAPEQFWNVTKSLILCSLLFLRASVINFMLEVAQHMASQ